MEQQGCRQRAAHSSTGIRMRPDKKMLGDRISRSRVAPEPFLLPVSR